MTQKFEFVFDGSNLVFKYNDDKSSFVKTFSLEKEKEVQLLQEENAPLVEPNNVKVLGSTSDETNLWVNFPKELTQIMKVSTEHGELVCSDCSAKVPDDHSLVTIKTPAGKSDIIVAIPDAYDGISRQELMSAIQNAVDILDDAPPLPDLKPTSPELDPQVVIPQVVEIIIKDNQLVLHDVSENVPENVPLIQINTPPEMPNIVAVMRHETAAKFNELGVDAKAAIESFLANSKTEIATVRDLDEVEVFASSNVTLNALTDRPTKLRRWTRW